MRPVDCLADMVALEAQMQRLLAEHAEDVRGHPGAEAALKRFRAMADDQRDALRARLSTIHGSEVDEPVWLVPLDHRLAVRGGRGHRTMLRRALHAAYSGFNHLALGYTILHAVAHRFYDSLEEGNTADLAEQHLRRYAAAAQEINHLISDVVVWELGSEGEECACQCPSCGLGICLCAPHGTKTVVQAWRETTPATASPGIEVRLPRTGSSAAGAGLMAGDRVIAVDGQQIATDLDTMTLQNIIEGHPSGTSVRIDLLRPGHDRVQATLTRS